VTAGEQARVISRDKVEANFMVDGGGGGAGVCLSVCGSFEGSGVE
jgi:hypothetical protein